jgi:hypothetical protein
MSKNNLPILRGPADSFRKLAVLLVVSSDLDVRTAAKSRLVVTHAIDTATEFEFSGLKVLRNKNLRIALQPNGEQADSIVVKGRPIPVHCSGVQCMLPFRYNVPSAHRHPIEKTT